MAISKKRNRTLSVRDQRYYYRVEMENYMMHLTTWIGLVSKPEKRLCLHAKQGDSFLKKVAGDPIGVVTPGLVSKAIAYALDHTAWATSDESVVLAFQDGKIGIYDWKSRGAIPSTLKP